MLEFVLNIGVDSWRVLAEMAPYLLFGFLVAGVLSVLIPPESVQRHFGGRGLLPVLKAAAFGVPLPLCSCGVIPVSASLRRHGASRGATTAFLISTPQTGADSILVTYSLLGGVVAVFRPLAALISGIAGGVLVTILGPRESKRPSAPNDGPDACCEGTGAHGCLYRALHHGFVALPRDIGKSLVVGLILAGVITALVPDDYFAGVLGGGMGTMLVMMLVGVPMYVCATASVPIAVALIAKGISVGAALVFLMTGPATNGATVAMIWNVMGRRATCIYLVSIALSALASGLALDHLFTSGIVPAYPHHVHDLSPEIFSHLSALVLLGVMTHALVIRRSPKAGAIDSGSTSSDETILMSISGMTCDHCVERVRKALSGVSGVRTVRVDLQTQQAAIVGNHLNRHRLRVAIEGLGFAVREDAVAGHP